jgi:flavin-dependent dehydrogenase
LSTGPGFPGPKVCGEGILPRGVSELERLGVLTAIASQSAGLDRLRFELQGRSAETWLSPWRSRGVGVQRAHLDAALLRRAEAAGAEVSLGVGVQGLLPAVAGRFRGVRTDRGEIEARLIVAADGLRSTLRAQAGLDLRAKRRRYGVGAHIRVERDAGSCIDVHFGGDCAVYVTPVSKRTVNVALLCDAQTAASFGGDLAGAFRARVVPVLGNAFELLDEARATGPFPAASRRAWQRNLLLAGDAAGFFDAISGEGISLALQSGRLAAEAVQAYLESGSEEPFRRYDRELADLRRPSMLFARLMLTLAAHPVLALRALGNLSRRPETFARLVAVNSGELRLRDLRPRDVLGLTVGL